MRSVMDHLHSSESRPLVRVSTAGSVDDGKSTFIGRLLYDCKGLYADRIESIRKLSGGEIDFSLFTDGLRAEREQKITIDVAYRYFSTPTRHFILADSPGHEQFTRNMATGASTANVAILIVDAKKGVSPQTKRHAFIASLLGIPRLLVAINKMDLVDWSEKRYQEIQEEFREFASRMQVKEIQFIPVSALQGDNVVHPSRHMDWFGGTTVIRHLEDLYVASDLNQVDFRFPIQYVIRPDASFRGYAGQIASGQISVGEPVMVLPSHQTAEVADVIGDRHSIPSARTPASVVLTLSREVEAGRGGMIVREKNLPWVTTEFDAQLVWMDSTPLKTGVRYQMKHTSRWVGAYVEELRYRFDINTLSRESVSTIGLNEIGRVRVVTTQPVFVDSYSQNRLTGSFILVDEQTHQTVAAGTVLQRFPVEKPQSVPSSAAAKNLSEEVSRIRTGNRSQRWGHGPLTVWFTGLSGSGKSTLSRELEKRLFDRKINVLWIDGDNVRHGLCSDLGFSRGDRRENIRRVAETAKLLNQAGMVVVCSLISPLKSDREMAQQIIGASHFFEVHSGAGVEVCEERDPKGLYRRARSGDIPEFSGVSSPYEPPERADLRLDTGTESVETSVNRLFEAVWARIQP